MYPRSYMLVVVSAKVIAPVSFDEGKRGDNQL